LQQGKAAASLVFVERGLTVNPNHPELQDLRTQARRANVKPSAQPATKPVPEPVTEPRGILRPVGTVVRVDRNWGFVVFEVQRSGTVAQGDRVFIENSDRTWQRLVVSKIANRKASAMTKGDLANIRVGMAIFAE
jgi:hypothetical protein